MRKPKLARKAQEAGALQKVETSIASNGSSRKQEAGEQSTRGTARVPNTKVVTGSCGRELPYGNGEGTARSGLRSSVLTREEAVTLSPLSSPSLPCENLATQGRDFAAHRISPLRTRSSYLRTTAGLYEACMCEAVVTSSKSTRTGKSRDGVRWRCLAAALDLRGNT